MTPERAREIDDVLLDSLKDGPKYLDMGHSPVEAIERCFELIKQGRVYMQSGWVYLNEPAPTEIKPDKVERSFPINRRILFP